MIMEGAVKLARTVEPQAVRNPASPVAREPEVSAPSAAVVADGSAMARMATTAVASPVRASPVVSTAAPASLNTDRKAAAAALAGAPAHLPAAAAAAAIRAAAGAGFMVPAVAAGPTSMVPSQTSTQPRVRIRATAM